MCVCDWHIEVKSKRESVTVKEEGDDGMALGVRAGGSNGVAEGETSGQSVSKKSKCVSSPSISLMVEKALKK